ncbi:MAG: 5'-methylthioadenosine/S-adenosylhomocysteine nucleosidase [Bacteroidales bacterium]|nr:5'-methylthioadenosine/S-adenosylhomocysteine nucleosidase [Bacteroidales bacterium]
MKRFLLFLLLTVMFCGSLSAKNRKIGLLVASEQKSVFEKYGKALKEETSGGFKVYSFKNKDYTLLVINSGVGEIAAAAATQVLIDVYDVELVVNFGVVGALTDEMTVTETCVIEKIVHYDFDLSRIDPVKKGQYPGFENEFLLTDSILINKALKVCPGLKKVTCASADKFVADKSIKETLHAEFSADICEMESAGIFLTCRRNNVPCLFIKAVSDSLTGGGKEYYQEYLRAAAQCLEITDKIIKSFL